MKAKVPIKLIKPSQLTVMFEVQREAVSSWVKRLAREFDLDAVFVLAVWHTPDGRYVIIDGQHRVLAMRELGINELIPCYVYENMTSEQACERFLELNHRKNVAAVDKFRLGVGAGIPECVGANRLINERGLVIEGDHSRNGVPTIACAATLLRYWNHPARERTGPQALSCALDIAIAAWGTDGDALNGTVIGGLARLHLDNPWIESKALSDRLAKSGPPARLLGTAKSLYMLHKGHNLDACMAKACGDVYNMRRSESSRIKVPF
jgi:ParB-like nuclease domain